MAPKKPAYNLAGTMPGDHGLDRIKHELLTEPRAERWAIIRFRNGHTGTDHPLDDEDYRAPILFIDSLEPVTETADIDQLRAMRTRYREARPGQGELGEGAAQCPTCGRTEGAAAPACGDCPDYATYQTAHP